MSLIGYSAPLIVPRLITVARILPSLVMTVWRA